ncbi:helix-turn-helix domain-containing protein [Calditerricola satsumensis]|uniref:Transcriptional regulator n=1 Tax=Calditerricola satsumensis TaxID=373054 RepID=A0A8J3BEK3_9BACI|nr:helix-turn-helix transcriptional regulator [Calditerricola satsumensis]GGK04837.1 transcriptional regulator [Calditerricola satsumensis]
MSLGQTIRTLRQRRGMSQSELAEGICTQSEISRIENDLVLPQLNTLKKIAARLGVTLYELSEGSEESSQRIETLRRIHRYVRQQKWQELAALLDEEEQSAASREPFFRAALTWARAVVVMEAEEKPHRAITLLHNLLHKMVPLTLALQGQVEMTLGDALLRTAQPEEARHILERAFHRMESAPSQYEPWVPVRTAYLLSLAHWQLQQATRSLYWAETALELADAHDLSYLVGQAHLQAAVVLAHTGRSAEAHRHLEKAACAARLTDDASLQAEIAQWEGMLFAQRQNS